MKLKADKKPAQAQTLNLQSAHDIRVAEEKAGQEIAQLLTRPRGPVEDRPKHRRCFRR